MALFCHGKKLESPDKNTDLSQVTDKLHYDFDLIYPKATWGRRGCDRMEDQFTTTCVISIYIH
jgi:hypothetical protein